MPRRLSEPAHRQSNRAGGVELVLLLFIKMEYENTESGFLRNHELPAHNVKNSLYLAGRDPCRAARCCSLTLPELAGASGTFLPA